MVGPSLCLQVIYIFFYAELKRLEYIASLFFTKQITHTIRPMKYIGWWTTKYCVALRFFHIDICTDYKFKFADLCLIALSMLATERILVTERKLSSCVDEMKHQVALW